MAGIDTLELSKTLRGFGFSDQQAEGLPKLLVGLVENTAATKSDIVRLESQIEKLEQKLDNRIEKLEHKMVARFYAGQIASVVAVNGALKLFHVF